MNFKKLLCVVLCIAMVLGTMSFSAFAAETPVAKVGNTEYATIDEAIANWTNGTTLTLLSDVTLSDVIKLSSTEHHILDLGRYTMTAASGKDAIQYVVNGRSSASYALDIKADATNPGGITATGKTIVSHIKPSSDAPNKDRPITRFYGGIFNAAYVVKQGATSNWGFLTSGYTGASAPYFQFYGGEYNGTIYTNRSQNQFYGGTFNGSMQMSVDSSAYTLVAGGTFKNLSNSMGSALNSDKFVIGTAKGANDGSVCIDENGYYVISTTTPAEAEASVASNFNSSNYFYYSTINTNGMYYEDVYDALEANTTGTVTVFTDELDLTDSSFTGTIVVPEGEEITIIVEEGTKPAWSVDADAASVTYADDEGNVLEEGEDGTFVESAPVYVAKIGEQGYETIQAAINAAQSGDTVEIYAGEYSSINISNKNITIKGTVGDNGELLTTIKGGDPAITGHSFNGTIKDIKIVDAWKVMYAEPAGNVTVDNVYVTGATYGFHLVAYSPDLTWTIQNSYMNLSWANSFGVYGDGYSDIIIKGNRFESTSPYYPDYGAIHVNSFLPSVTVEENIFGKNAKIYIDAASVTDTSKINISKNYHAEGVENAFANDAEGITVPIYQYYTEVDADGNLTGLVEIPSTPAAPVVAKIGETTYASLAEAVAAAESGDTITVIADVTDEAVSVNKNVTITGNATLTNVSFNAVEGCSQLTVTDLAFAGNSWINSGAADKLTVSGVNANVTPSNGAYTNSRSGFISLGRSEQKQLELTVEGCNIVSNGGTDPIIGWASVTKVNIKNNTFGSETAYQTNSDSVKFMAIADGAKFTISGNTVYSNYNGFVFGQNTTRDNEYTAVIENNTFVGNADHIWIEVSGANTTHAKILVSSDNAVNGNAITLNDVKYLPSINTWTGYVGLDVILDENGKITGGTFTEYSAALDTYLAEGYTAIAELTNGYYVVGATPTATVNNLGAMTIPAGEYVSLGGGSISEDMELNFVMQFLADQDAEDMETSPYADWYGDFVITFTGIENGSFTADGCYLAGYYGSFGWVKVPVDGMVVENGARYPVMLGYGAGQKYDYICESVKDFRCAMYLTPEILAANPNLKVNLELSVVDNSAGSDAATEALTEGKEGTFYKTGSTEYTAEDFATPVAKVGETEYATLAEAFAAAQNGDTVTLLEDVAVDSETYTIADGTSITLDMNGKKITVTDSKNGTNSNANYELFYIYGEMTVTGNGTIELTSTYNRAWNAMSAIFHNRGGVLTIKNGTYKNLGGTDMAWVIDNSGNYYGDAVTNIEDGTLECTYTAIRNRMEQNSHGASGTAILNIYGGTVIGTTSAVWAQAASISETSPATGVINVTGGNVGIINTARSTGAECMTTVSGGTVSGFKGEVGELTVTGGSIGNVTMMNAAGEVVDFIITDDGLYIEAPAATPVAKIGDAEYTSLQAAVDAAANGDTITVLTDVALDATVKVPAGTEITLDLNGKTITSTDKNTSGNFYLIDNRGELTVTGNGKITLVAETNRAWNSSSVVIANNPGGKLIVENGTIEHLGGTDMAYALDNLTNGKGTYAETVINGGTIKSTYRAVRQFLNGVEAQNILTINGGVVEGANKSIFFHDPSKNANSGTLTVAEGATLNGDVYLFVTEGSTEWPVEVSIAKSAVNGEIVSKNVPEGYEVVENNGIYGVVEETTTELFKVAGDSASLDSSLALNIYVNAADLTGENYYAVVEHTKETGVVTTTIPYVEWVASGNYKAIRYTGIAAKEMADNIKIIVYTADDTQVSEPYETSLRKYALATLTRYEGTNSPWLTALTDMLNYGAAAQIMFNYNTDDLANTGAEAFQQYASTEYTLDKEGCALSDAVAGTTLTLEDVIKLNFYYKDVTDGMKAKYSYTTHAGTLVEETVEYDSFISGWGYKGVSVGVAIADADTLVTVTMFDDDNAEVGKAIYSVNAYLKDMIDDGKTDELYTALAKFAASAKEAFANK